VRANLPGKVFVRSVSGTHDSCVFTFLDALRGFMLDQQAAIAAHMDEESIRKIFARHGSLFGGLFHTAIVLWAFLRQILSDGKEALCRLPIPSRRDKHLGLDFP
jgi:hypothetical protein